MESGVVLAVFFIAAVISVVIISKVMNREQPPQAGQEQQAAEIEIGERFFMGQYKSGLPGFQGTAPIVYCGVTNDFFVLRKGTQGVEIGRIPRTSIHDVALTNQDAKNCLVNITWRNKAEENIRAQFQFSDKNAWAQATAAAENISKWILAPDAAQTCCAASACS